MWRSDAYRRKSKRALPTLTYHESIPGHHLQPSIQQEADLPLIRKVSFYSAYGEGWALYAEQLAAEMGEYDDDPLGHSCRLRCIARCAWWWIPACTASNGHGSRRCAYFADTLGDPETVAITEVEHYCVWPEQACAYMLGKLAFFGAALHAQKVYCTKYDIRKFHDAMLLAGALPLELLEKIYT